MEQQQKHFIGDYEIVERAKTADTKHEIALSFSAEAAAPWATHTSGTTGGWVWGHYFSDEREAREDFAERIKRGY